MGGFDGVELTALAKVDLENDHLTEALAKLKSATRVEDAPADAWSMLGKLYARLAIFDRAESALATYLTLKPEALQERFEYGLVQYENGNPEGALATWDRVLDGRPDYPPAMFYKAILLIDRDRRDNAIALLQKLIESVDETNLYAGKAREALEELGVAPVVQAENQTASQETSREH